MVGHVRHVRAGKPHAREYASTFVEIAGLADHSTGAKRYVHSYFAAQQYMKMSLDTFFCSESWETVKIRKGTHLVHFGLELEAT